jgi:hypothetical protein
MKPFSSLSVMDAEATLNIEASDEPVLTLRDEDLIQVSKVLS